MTRATLDVGRMTGPPLAKKFGVMNAGILPLARYERDLPKTTALRPDSLRVDLSIGKKVGWKGQMVTGSPETLLYDWSELDRLTDALAAQGVRPYYAFCYMPRPLQKNGNWRSAPSELAAWREANRAFAEHHRGKHATLEVYNEPDFREFFVGTREEYLTLYSEGALGMRDGDPDGVVGGPALAFSMDWVDPFLDHVRDHRLPLDFFSFHAIGIPLQDPPSRQVALDRLRTIRAALAARPGFETTEIHLNEYHPYKNTAEGLEKSSSSADLAVELLEDFVAFLDEDDLTLVHWAQLMDSGFGGETFGLLDEEGRVRPAFYAFAAYDDLPVRRIALDVGGSFAGIAGGNASKGGVLIWNRSDRTESLVLEGLPTSFQEFRIDGDVSFEACAETPGLPLVAAHQAGTWSGTLGAKEIVYLRWDDRTSAPPLSATLVRTHYRVSSGHGTFDRRSMSAHVDSGVVGATLTGLPDRIGLQVEAAPGKLALRVDYAIGEGYARSLLVRDGGEAPVPPWGTRRRPSEILERPLRGPGTLDLGAHAPEGWLGGALLTFASDVPALFALQDLR